MKKINVLVFVLGLFFLLPTTLWATHYYSKSSGNLNTLATWTTDPAGGSGSTPANFTTANDTFEIRNQTTATIGANWTVTTAKVIVGDGSTTIEFVIPSTFRLTGNVTVRAQATLTISNATLPTIDATETNSTVKYNASGAQAVPSKTFYNLEIGGTTAKTSGGDITVNGLLTIASGATLNMDATTEEILGTPTGTSGTGLLRTTSIATAPIPSNITWSFSVEMYRANGGQSVPAGTYSTLSFTGTSGTNTAQGAVSVSSSLSVPSGTTLTMAAFQLSGAFTPSGTGTITTAYTSSNPIPSGKTWTQAVTYNANGFAQNIMKGTYASLAITTGSDVNTATDTIIISSAGTFNLATNNTLDMSTYPLIFGTGITITGTGTGPLKTQNTSATPIPAGQTWPMAISYYNTTTAQTVVDGSYAALDLTGNDRTISNANPVNISGTFTLGSGTITTTGTSIVLTGAAQAVNLGSGNTFNNLSFTGSGTKTISGGNLVVDGTLNVGSGVTVSLATLTLSGNLTSITGTGTISTSNTGSTPIPSGKTWTQTVIYAAVGTAQTIMAGTYGGLSLTGATDINTASGDITVSASGTLNVATNNTFDLTTSLLTLGSSVVISGTGTIKTQNTSATPISSGFTWTQTLMYYSTSPQTVVAGDYVALNLTGGDRTIVNGTTINVSGAFTMGTGTLTADGSTVVLDGAATQAISVAATGTTFENLTVSAGTIKTISTGSITLKGVLTIASGTTLAMGANVLSGSNITSSGTGTLTTTNTTSSTPIPAAKTWSFVVSYSGTNQTVSRGNYDGGLTIAGTSGTKTLGGNTSVGTSSGGILTINTSRVLAIGAGNTLTINGTIDGVQTGTITGTTTSDIVIGNNSTDAGTLLMTQTSNTTRSIRNLTLSRNSGADALIIGNAARIITLLTITDGTLNANGNLTFESTAINTSAQIGEVTGTGDVSGNVNVERFVQGRTIASNTRWRFLASSVTTSGSISANWQQQIYITGSGTGGTVCPSLTSNSNGFDATLSNNPSFYSWNTGSQTWSALSNTNSNTLTAGEGYRVFVRGTRAQGCTQLGATPSTPADAVLIATGTLTVGGKTINCGTAGQFTLVGNPYQSTIDWASAGVSKTNIHPTIAGFKPNGTANGAYGTFILSPDDSTNGMTRFILPGSSFFVYTTSGSGSITFNESCKVPTFASNGTAYFKTGTGNAPYNVMRVQLFDDVANSEMLDEAVFRMYPSTSWSYENSVDALKLGFAARQIALYTSAGTEKYSICRVPPTQTSGKDTIYLNVNLSATAANYKLNFAAVNSFDADITATLVDNFTGTTQNLKNNGEYSFSTTTSTSSAGAGRFYVIFENTGTSLPVVLTAFTAEKENATSKLSWSTSSEINSDRFDIERSKDASTGFETIGSVPAKGKSSQLVTYNWVDLSPVKGITNYYRLNQLDKNGAHMYSKVVAVDHSSKSLNELKVSCYPVPVTGLLTVEISNNKTAISPSQEVLIFDIYGKQVASLHMGNASNETYSLDMSSLNTGMYIMQTVIDGEIFKYKFTKQ